MSNNGNDSGGVGRHAGGQVLCLLCLQHSGRVTRVSDRNFLCIGRFKMMILLMIMIMMMMMMMMTKLTLNIEAFPSWGKVGSKRIISGHLLFNVNERPGENGKEMGNGDTNEHDTS